MAIYNSVKEYEEAMKRKEIKVEPKKAPAKKAPAKKEEK